MIDLHQLISEVAELRLHSDFSGLQKLDTLLLDVDKTLCQKVLSKRDYIKLFLRTEINRRALHTLPVDSSGAALLAQKIDALYKKLQQGIINALDSLYISDLLQKTDELYCAESEEIENKRRKDNPLWGDLASTIFSLMQKAHFELTSNTHLRSSIESDIKLKAEKALTHEEQCLIDIIQKIIADRKTDQALKSFIEKEIISQIRLFMRVERLCNDFGIKFHGYLNHGRSPTKEQLAPLCNGIVMAWGKSLLMKAPKKEEVFLQSMIPIITDLRADKFPKNLMLQKFYQGEELHRPFIHWCRSNIKKLLIQAGKPAIVKKPEEGNPLLCEGRQLALDALGLLNQKNKPDLLKARTTPARSRLLASKHASKPENKRALPALGPKKPELLVSTVVEATLNTLNPKRFQPHMIGMAKITRGTSDHFYFVDSQFGNFSATCPKQFAEWMQRFFELLHYNNLYTSYSIRNIDRSLGFLASMEKAKKPLSLESPIPAGMQKKGLLFSYRSGSKVLSQIGLNQQSLTSNPLNRTARKRTLDVKL